MNGEVSVQRSELRGMAVSMWLAASFAWLGAALLLQRFTSLSLRITTACGFLIAVAAWYPLARLFYRLRGYDVSPVRYAVVWLAIAFTVTAVRFLVG
jgi:hypothetical protein